MIDLPMGVPMFVRLTKKLADVVDGVDISHCTEGDVIALPTRHAQMLIAEGWAEEAPAESTPRCAPVWRPDAGAVARERPTRSGAARRKDDDELISQLRKRVDAAWSSRMDNAPQATV